MQKVTHSEYIAQKKPLAKQLLAKLNEKYQYASVLITDNYEKGYRASRSGVAISATNAFGGKGMIVKVYDGKGYAEYSTNEITAMRAASRQKTCPKLKEKSSSSS